MKLKRFFDNVVQSLQKGLNLNFATGSISVNAFQASLTSKTNVLSISLREKCPNTEFFLVRILPYLD